MIEYLFLGESVIGEGFRFVIKEKSGGAMVVVQICEHRTVIGEPGFRD